MESVWNPTFTKSTQSSTFTPPNHVVHPSRAPKPFTQAVHPSTMASPHFENVLGDKLLHMYLLTPFK